MQIGFKDGEWLVPDQPTVGYIIGDGVGQDISPVARKVIDAAVQKASAGKQRIDWQEILAGERAEAAGKERLGREALDAIKRFRVVLKGPLTTPVGGGHRSLNVTIRKQLDLYACVRPVKHIPGVPASVMEPEKVDVVIFRENTEDVYAGIEWPAGSLDAKDMIAFLKGKGHAVLADSGIGIKPISKTATRRLVTAAIDYAIAHKRTSVTLVHKGNIMKFTEGLFREEGYKTAVGFKEVVTEESLEGRKAPTGKIVIQDRIADAMFQQLLLRPDEYDVIATTNLNGDYLSDAAAAQVGGLGMAPGANINYEQGIAVFEATHGTAPKYAGQDKVNPSSLLLSGVMLLEILGWDDAAGMIRAALAKTVRQKRVTYDLERQMTGAKLLKCSEFGKAIIANL